MSETTIYMRHQNPGAALPLTIPVHLLVNVADEVIAANVRENTKRKNMRIRTEEPHNGLTAVICGSGPSLKDHLEEIRELQAYQPLFALNGAAQYLVDNGMEPFYQVLVDARERTAELVCDKAWNHLFASQCHPSCFDKAPNALMWHFINGDLESMLPPDEPAHAQIGGAGSVGNCALALAWAMGYRRFELYGYDSSHRGDASHAFHQPLNDFEPWGRFTFKGREYLCSYTMRSQASRFQAVAQALLNNGCTVNVHGDGLLPDMWRETLRIRESGTLEERERAKYELAWAIPEYRDMSPALRSFDDINAMLGAPTSGRLIDFGCGSGRATAKFREQGLDVLGVDLVPDAIEADIPFRQVVLWDLPADVTGDYGICCDVMEHIPTNKVSSVLAGISWAVTECVFQIATRPDEFGASVGAPLHLTVKDAEWWGRELAKHWLLVRCTHSGDGEARFHVKHLVKHPRT